MTDDTGRLGGPTGLTAMRTDRSRRWAATLVAASLGLLAASLHWVGFVIAGALVALPQRSLTRGVAAGLTFGVVAWLVFAVTLVLAGSFDTYLTLGQVLGVSVAIPLVGSGFGGLARGIV